MENKRIKIIYFFILFVFVINFLYAQSSSGTSVTTGGRRPNWIDDPYNLYNRNNFLAAVGFGTDRSQAEARAISALAAIFGQSVSSELIIADSYTETANRGVTTVTQDTSVQDRITTAASMDNLMGAEIGRVWDSRRGTVYAIAFLEKRRAISIYTDFIFTNNRNIDLLTMMNQEERTTFNGYARFIQAASLARTNAAYASVISQLGGSTSSLDLRSAESLNLEAENIKRSITITVNVDTDRANRLQNAFARIITAEGFRTRGINPVYTLEVNVTMTELTYPGNDFIFCRIEVGANLIENATGASLVSFSLDERAGHNSYTNAQTAAFTRAERIITERFTVVLREYLGSLIE